MDTFAVEREKSGFYTVSSGDRYQDKLGLDECLYLVACLLLQKGEPTLLLKTKEEHATYWARLSNPEPVEPLLLQTGEKEE
jgi:hypothetical protein